MLYYLRNYSVEFPKPDFVKKIPVFFCRLQSLSVVEALSEDQFGIHFSIAENLLNAMDYLASKLQQKKYIDYSNSNNNLNNKVSSWNRDRVSSLMLADIKKVERNPKYLIEIFD